VGRFPRANCGQKESGFSRGEFTLNHRGRRTTRAYLNAVAPAVPENGQLLIEAAWPNGVKHQNPKTPIDKIQSPRFLSHPFS
jgi:hypothetical protein